MICYNKVCLVLRGPFSASLERRNMCLALKKVYSLTAKSYYTFTTHKQPHNTCANKTTYFQFSELINFRSKLP